MKNAVLGYRKKQDEKVILDGLSFALHPGELLCVLGANGVGKTTMFRSILGFLPLLGGSILADGEEISGLTRSALAKKIAYVPQYHTPPFPYTVFDVVLMGRNAHLNSLAVPGEKDKDIALEMIERMGISHLKDEVYTEISGGERQLTLIARALAQKAAYILMDEPASNLDFGNQVRMLRTLKSLAKDGIGVCFTSHYPAHALMTDASVLAIEGKRQNVRGRAKDVITEELLHRMYGIDARIGEISGIAGEKQRVIIARI